MTDGPSWVPRREVFVRRAALTAAVTFVALLLLGLAAAFVTRVTIMGIIPFACIVTFGFFVDDVMRWRGTKFDRWQIADGHLIHEGGDGTARVPLTEIDRVFTRMGGRVVVQLRSGQRIAMRYLPYPDKTAKAIDAACSN